MAAAIKGTAVSFGIPSGVASAINTAVTAGIVENFQYSVGGNTAEIVDEDGDIVSRVDHGAKVEFSFDVICLATTTVPLKGAAIAGLPTTDGITFGTNSYVEGAEVTFSSTEVKKLSVKGVHYPAMGA